MIPIISTASYQPVNPVTSAALFSAQSDAAIGRLAPQAVSATISVPDSQNQSRGNGAGRGQSSSNTIQQGLSNPLAILNTSASVSTPSSTSNFSSLFLAQLFGQGASQDSGLLGSYLGSFPPSNTLSYETMIAYSRVKYKPSNAALVQLDIPTQNIAEAPQPSSNAQSRELIARALQNQTVQQDTVSNAALVRDTATPTQSNFAAVLSAAPLAKYTAPKPASGNPSSLIRTTQGTDSYAATSSRNALNLEQDLRPQYRLSL